jgi:hypothetical protein
MELNSTAMAKNHEAEARRFPTRMQVESCDDINAQILGILRREASHDQERFVSLEECAGVIGRFYMWPERIAGPREEFFEERIRFFVRIGVIKRAQKQVSGKRVRGVIVPASLYDKEQDAGGLTKADREFLSRCGIRVEEPEFAEAK